MWIGILPTRFASIAPYSYPEPVNQSSSHFAMHLNGILLSGALLVCALPAVAQVVITETYDFPVGFATGSIPDNGSAITFSQSLAGSQIASLTQVEIELLLSGDPIGQGWAGDMYVSLNRNLGGQTAILLNQVGVTISNPLGSSFDGWNVTFRDSAANGDIHFAEPSAPATILGGIWQPDGRLAPTDTLRPARLDVFNGTSGSADWHLTLADLAPGGTMTLQHWSLTLTGIAAAPESIAWASITAVALVSFGVWYRRSN